MSADNKNISIFEELKRRNVYRVGLAYVVLTWLLLQVIDTLGPIFELPEWAPKLVLTILGIGFPAVMLFAWAFELTPEGIKREKDVDRSQSITSNTGQRLDRITIGVLLVAVGMLLVDKFFISDAPAPVQLVAADIAADVTAEIEESPSIAVLPFVNMSDDKSSTYFSDGLADTVLHMLAQVREIRVAARTSSFQFRDQSMDISEIGNQLNVGTVLEGSVQRAGDKIRITAQLIDVENGFHLWSGNFDRDLDDVFAIQDEIANEVVAALKVSLLGEVAGSMDSDQTDNLDAYTEYLLGISDLSDATSETLSSAIVHLQKAVAHDPNYARGWSTLGRAYIEMEDYGSMATSEAVTAARNAANRALNLAPNSSEALAVLGMTELIDNNVHQAGLILQRAIETGPNDVVALNYYSMFLGADGKSDERIRTLQKAIRLDPLSEDAYINLSNAYMAVDQLEDATQVVAKLSAINPESVNAAGFGAFIAFQRGEIARAIREMIAAQDLDPGDAEPAFMVGLMYLSLDLPLEAKQWMDRATEIDAQHPVARAGPLFLNYYSQQANAENVRLAKKLLGEGIENRRGARYMALRVLLDHGADTGDYEPVLAALDSLYPHLFDDPPHDLDKSYMATHMAGIALASSGAVERGNDFLRWWDAEAQSFEEVYGVGRDSITVSLVLGDKTEALQKLQNFSESDFSKTYHRMFLENDALFDTVRDEPQFIALLDNYRVIAEQQRELLQAMNAN